MAIEDIKTPTTFLINDEWKAIDGGSDLKKFINTLVERAMKSKGPPVIVQNRINSEWNNKNKLKMRG